MARGIIINASFLTSRQAALGCLLMILALYTMSAASAWTCAYVSSYHKGYAWSDGVERGLRAVLQGQCDIVQFDMDSKRNRSEAYIRQKAEEIAAEITRIKPDVLIVSDDNAAKYLAVPYFNGGQLPVVFCGINWTVDEYKFSPENVTGMVEVAPVRPLLRWAKKLNKGASGRFIGAKTLTAEKNLAHVEKEAVKLGIKLESVLVDNQLEWQNAFDKTDGVDFIYIGSSAGISEWDEDANSQFIRQHADKLLLTNHDWMMPFAMLGFVKLPEEQGVWAGKTAIAIHQGLPVNRIPVISNREWEIFENPSLLNITEISLPKALRAKAKKYNQGK